MRGAVDAGSLIEVGGQGCTTGIFEPWKKAEEAQESGAPGPWRVPSPVLCGRRTVGCWRLNQVFSQPFWPRPMELVKGNSPAEYRQPQGCRAVRIAPAAQGIAKRPDPSIEYPG